MSSVLRTPARVRPTSVFPTPASPSMSSGRSSVRERYTAVARSRSATYRSAAKAAWTESMDSSLRAPISCNLLGAFPDARRELVPEALRELLGGALQEPGPHARHRAADLRAGAPLEARPVRGEGLDFERGAHLHARAGRLAVGRHFEALGRVHVRQPDVELKFHLHGTHAEPRDHLEVPVVDRLHRLDSRCHRCHELVIEQPPPHDLRRRGDLGRAGEVESHYFARSSAWVSARRAATVARCVRYSGPAWMSSFASTPATAAAATCEISSSPDVPTSFAAAGARNGVSASPVNASSARVIIPLAIAISAAAPANAYPDAACSKLAYAIPAPLGSAGSWISVSSSLGFMAAVEGPFREFWRPPGGLSPLDCNRNVASSTSITRGISAARSAWAKPPPLGPPFPPLKSPICSVTSAMRGYSVPSSLDSSSSR